MLYFDARWDHVPPRLRHSEIMRPKTIVLIPTSSLWEVKLVRNYHIPLLSLILELVV